MGADAKSELESAIELKTLAVTLFCLIGAAYSSFLLYQNLHSLGARDGTPMAKLQHVEQKVRFKPAQSFVWSSAGAHENLYLKDSIQTPPGGGASIVFNDGTKLEIGENSLIIIDSIENLSLNFLRGSVVVQSQAGDTKVTVGKDGKAETVRLAARLVSPEPLAEYFIPEKTLTGIKFSWQLHQKEGQSGPDTLEISSSPSFRDAHRESFPIDKDMRSLVAKVSEGEHYWRILSQQKPMTGSSRFRVHGVAPLQPLSPSADEVIPAFGGEVAVRFQWAQSADESAAEQGDETTHWIELAAEPQFTKVLAKQEIAPGTGISAFNGIHEGRYFWRILSQYPGLTLRSDVEHFQVEKVTRAPADLTAPAENSSLDMNKELRFNWRSDATNIQYRWQIRSVSRPDKIQSIDTKLKTQSWKSPGPGAYQWRVESLYREQVVGETAWRGFSALDGKPMALREPSPGKEIHYWVEASPFEFKWEKLKSASGYILEVASNPDFKNATTFATEADGCASKVVAMTPGEQFWHVKALNSSHEVLNISSTGRFTYSPYPLLRAPASAKPDSGSIINPLETEKDVTISWSPVEKAEGYHLTITRVGEPGSPSTMKGDHVLLEKDLKENELELKGLSAGKYQYTVQAIDHGSRKGEALTKRLFTISFGDPLSAPETLSPEIQ